MRDLIMWRRAKDAERRGAKPCRSISARGLHETPIWVRLKREDLGQRRAGARQETGSDERREEPRSLALALACNVSWTAPAADGVSRPSRRDRSRFVRGPIMAVGPRRELVRRSGATFLQYTF